MSHFAEVDSANIVLRVIVAEQEFIDSGAVGDPTSWIATSYNTQAGKHLLGGTPLRGNFAGIGFTYDVMLDAFLPPSPYPSWRINPKTFSWVAPLAMPSDGATYIWNERKQQWVRVSV